MDRMVAMLTKLGHRGYLTREEPHEHDRGKVGSDSDPDSDSDPEIDEEFSELSG